jgi:hypothetical protein
LPAASEELAFRQTLVRIAAEARFPAFLQGLQRWSLVKAGDEEPIRFVPHGAQTEVRDRPATMTLLDWLRLDAKLTGTVVGIGSAKKTDISLDTVLASSQ